MKTVVIGANGTIGSLVAERLKSAGHEVIPVGHSSGAFRVSVEDPASVDALFRSVGRFDALAVAAGHVAFKPFAELREADWAYSLGSKLMGQVRLATAAIPFLSDGGSITLISGVTAREPIRGGVAAAAVSRALEGFAMAAAPELPRGIRINVISPTVLDESMEAYASLFQGHESVPGTRVANAYLKAIAGGFTGQTLIP
ncbi:MAG: short chain dehydrogenase [Bdellovibrionota bacterium]